MSEKIGKYIINHDEKLTFNIAYVTLSIVLSAVFNLYWLIVIVTLHLFLDIYVSMHSGKNFGKAVLSGLWKLKLDFVLILFSIVVFIYLEAMIGALAGQGAKGLKGAQGVKGAASSSKIGTGGKIMKIGSQTGKALKTSEKIALGLKSLGPKTLATIRTVLNFTDDVPKFLIMLRNNGSKYEKATENESFKITWGDIIVLGFGVLFLGMILLFPFIFDLSFSESMDFILKSLES